MPDLSRRSASRLATCRVELVVLVSVVATQYNLTVLEGSRSLARQRHLFENGLSKTMESSHLVTPENPLSNAVDVTPYPIPDDWGSLRSDNRQDLLTEWKERVKFYELQAVLNYEAKRLGYWIRSGADWDGDGDYRDQSFDELVHLEYIGRTSVMAVQAG